MIHKFKSLTALLAEVIGYESWTALFQNALVIKLPISWGAYIIGLSFTAFLSFVADVNNFTEAYIYAPILAVHVLFYTHVANFALGIAASVITREEAIKGNKLSKAAARFVVQMVFISLMFLLNKALPIYIQKFMVDWLLLVFWLSTAYSALGNAKDLDLISEEQYETITAIVQLKGLFNKIKSIGAKKNPNTPPNDEIH